MATRNTLDTYSGYAYDAERRWDEDEFSPSRQSRPKRKEQRLPETLKTPAYTRVQRRKNKAVGKNIMYMAIALGVVCLFIQVARYARIAVNSKQISSLRTELQELDKQKENYELRISAREKSDRLDDEVIGLGCFAQATEEQTRIIVLNREKPMTRTIIAANTAK